MTGIECQRVDVKEHVWNVGDVKEHVWNVREFM